MRVRRSRSTGTTKRPAPSTSSLPSGEARAISSSEGGGEKAGTCVPRALRVMETSRMAPTRFRVCVHDGPVDGEVARVFSTPVTQRQEQVSSKQVVVPRFALSKQGSARKQGGFFFLRVHNLNGGFLVSSINRWWVRLPPRAAKALVAHR